MEDIKNRANDVDETMAQINRTTISLNQSLGGSEVYLQTIGKNITDAASAILQVSSDITTFEEAQKKAGELIADIQDKTYPSSQVIGYPPIAPASLALVSRHPRR